MSSGNVEDRIQRLEQKVRQLEEVARSDGKAVAWWERIAGAFQGDEVYAAAMKLGAEMRKADQLQESVERSSLIRII